jgi:biotin---protein ligase
MNYYFFFLSNNRNEIVTLTTVKPPVQVRLVGITPDHGLLRTVPEKLGDKVSEKDYVDLRPDGNSFDLMKGLISTKK